ncbi:histidine kinase dimerization/phosphoacceptor domain -containing protein [Agrobacterium vitis]|uniref:sensor histidine kinase n=1 Tax=Agrobacterium vitis TaxID=373 RepID=UPI0018D20BF4
MDIAHSDKRFSKFVLGAAAIPIWLSSGFLLVLLIFGGLLVSENYRAALKNGEARALASAQVVATNAGWIMEASNQALRRIDTALGPDGIRSSPGEILDIVNAVGDLPVGFTYSVFDDSGQLRSSSIPNAQSINHKDRPYFQKLQAGADMTIARLAKDEQLDASAFIIARRIMRGGTFRGAASITIANSFVDRFWSTMGLGPKSTVTILRNDGWLMARHPEPDGPIDLSKAAWFPQLQSNSNGIYHSPVSPIDGVARIVAFWKVEGWPVVALAAIDRAEVLELFWQNLSSELLFIVPLMIVLALAAVWITWLLHRYALRNEELEKSAERNTFLFREIHHRVKNNLQTVQALVRLQPLPAEVRTDMSRRIAAMVAVHEQIYQNDQFERVEIAPYIRKLVVDIAVAYNKQVALDVELEPMTVDREQALPLGMLINEIVSNAFKYAFNDGADGRLTVRLSQQDDCVVLIIRDNGKGFAPESVNQGMGSKLITGFVSQLRGDFTYKADGGTVFTLRMPIE